MQARIELSTARSVLFDYIELCKPRVVALMLLTAWVGMCLATPHWVTLRVLFCGLLGIGLCAGSAAAINHLVDKRIDALMSRTQKRPIAQGRIASRHAAYFAGILACIGFGILSVYVNVLTAVLTLLTLVGYAGIYTGYLKRATPQNIVIGGLAGAAPPLLGWVAVTNHLDAYPLLLVLIIFTWTPPHFWALAIYRFNDYQHAQIPMLPVTHGIDYTKLHIVLYAALLLVVSVLPFAVGMSGLIYLVGALLLGTYFFASAWRLYVSNEKIRAMRTFRSSIIYLMVLFVVLLVDHYVR